MRLKRRVLVGMVGAALSGLVVPAPAMADVESIEVDTLAEGDYYTFHITGSVECSDDQAGYPFQVTVSVLDNAGETVEAISPRSSNRCTGSPQPFSVRLIECRDGFDSGRELTVTVDTFMPERPGNLSDSMSVSEFVGFSIGGFMPRKPACP